MIDREWKLVAPKAGPWELYNIFSDRTEMANLAPRHPDIVARLDAQWQHWARDHQVTPLPSDYGVGYLKSKATSP